VLKNCTVQEFVAKYLPAGVGRKPYVVTYLPLSLKRHANCHYCYV